jgi:hypothetical protein
LLVGLPLLIALPVLYSVNLSLIPAWSPEDVAGALRVLWQVDAAALAIAFPLLILFLQVTPGPAVLTRKATEVLLQATEAYRTGAVLLMSVILIGVGAIWFPSDESAVMLFLVFVAALCLLGSSFSRALVLLMDHEKFKALSNAQLRKRLEASMTVAWLYARADQVLTEALAARDITLTYSLELLRPVADEWFHVFPETDGTLVDVEAEELAKAIDNLMPTAVSQVQYSTPNHNEGQYDRMVALSARPGDRVGRDRPLFSIPWRPAGEADAARVRSQILRTFVIKASDG